MSAPTTSAGRAEDERAELTFRELFRIRPASSYLVGSAASSFGDSLVPLALAFAVLRLSGSVELLGVAVAASRLPAVIVCLVGGVVGDRFRPRRVAVLANAASLMLNVLSTVALLVLPNRPAVVALIVIQVLAGSVSAFSSPISSKLAGLLFREPAQIRAAAAFSGTIRNAVHVAATGMSGVLVLVGSPAVCFAINAASYLVFIVCLPKVIGEPAVAAPERRSFSADFVIGARAVRQHRQFTWALANTVACWLIVIQPFLVLTPAILQSVDSRSASVQWGLISAFIGVGGILGGLGGNRLRPRDAMTGVVSLALLDVPLLVVLAVWPGSWVMYSLAALTGWQSTTARVWLTQETYTTFDKAVLGRVQSLMYAAWLMPAFLSSLFTPWLADQIGARRTFGWLAGVFVVVGIVMTNRVAAARRTPEGALDAA